ncbi:cysteine--tRNA ligase [Candidatus Micrarchaeota archaeon]|nr:cysteine--tRNA ligase [Candidatus Micrarchaeota archaeon]
MALALFNNLTRKKEAFKPAEPGVVKFYGCGPTLYANPHLGNCRAFLFYDLLRRWMEYEGNKVRFVMNITDVDDKTIRKAGEEGKTLEELYELYAKPFFEDLGKLGVKKAEAYPRATKHIPQMVRLVQALEDKGLAYKGEDGSFYFKISAFKKYGKLSHIDAKGLKPGASGRVGHDEYEKENASDFALWKAWTPDDGCVFWQTPLGKGRPGWHIECSAMSMHYLGETLDIHAGGVDLLFPHHENEIAQSEGATGKQFARFWVHNEHLLVNGMKMAKRLKNFFTLGDILAKNHSPAAVRWLLLCAHYRQQLNFTFESLNAASASVDALMELKFNIESAMKSPKEETKGDVEKCARLCKGFLAAFKSAMDDDLNTPNAIAALFSFAKEANKLAMEGKVGRKGGAKLLDALRKADSVLGILEMGEGKGKEGQVPMEQKAIEKKIAEREAARKKKDFAASDAIRNELLENYGVILEDTPSGARWRRK